MRRREAERIARRAVPGSGAPHLSPLSKGLLHETFRVERDGRAFSMRLAAAPRGWPPRGWPPRASRYPAAQDEAWLLRVLQSAADQALAPPLVYGDAERGIIVQSWIEGRAWPAGAVRRTQNIERVAALLRRVHALAVPAPARAVTPRLWVRRYSAKGSAKGTVKRVGPALAAAAAGQLQRLEELPAITGVVCHSDLHRLNMLEWRPPPAKAGALLLLDWEYAHVSEPLWDLAGWSANNDYTEVLQRRLLAAYLERAPDEAEWMRCKILNWLYDYVCLLWSELYLSSRRGGPPELAPRAALLQARLQARLSSDSD
jgi:thiamine kinase-like enzyme